MFDFENTITYILTQAAVAYRNNLEKSLNTIGLHSGQIFVLISLWQNDGQSQIDLVKNLDVSAPTVNKMVKSLANAGFVECRKCQSDGRLMRVFLTDKGIACQDSVAERWVQVESFSYSNLTETEKLMLLQLFGKLRTNLKQNVNAD